MNKTYIYSYNDMIINNTTSAWYQVSSTEVGFQEWTDWQLHIVLASLLLRPKHCAFKLLAASSAEIFSYEVMDIRIALTVYKLFSELKKFLGIGIVVLLLVTLTYTSLHGRIKQIRFSPNAVLGYAACSTTHLKPKIVSFTKDYPCNFSTSLPAVNGLTVVTFVNTGWINLTKNWLYSAENSGLKGSIFLITLEAGVCEHFPGVPCFHKATAEIHSASFGEPKYQKFMLERTRLILQLLSCPLQTILLADADTVFLRGSLQLIKEEMVKWISSCSEIAQEYRQLII